MSIRYVSNDPGAMPRLERQLSPTAAPSGQRARFSYSRSDPEAVYANDDDPEFVYWQCQEAAHQVLSIWEQLAGPLRFWQNGQRSLPVNLDQGLGLQALYDRSQISFYRFDLTQPETYVAASSDAVAHEVGHAILDSLRPDLWNSLLPEVAAFHEGFADCVALLVALFDDDQRSKLFSQAVNPADVLQAVNSAETITESIASAFAAFYSPGDPRTLPRQCNNTLQWALPSSLPPHAPGGHLSREPHSFGRVFTGCFFDLAHNLYTHRAVFDQQGLLDAADLAGRLLVEAVKVAPHDPRFFQAVGRSMILIDEDSNASANHLAIRDAFNNHGIALGSSAMLAPSVPLDGPAPSVRASGASSTALVAQTRHSLCDVLGTPRSTPISLKSLKIGKRRVSRGSFSTRVSLAAMGKRLAGVSAHIHQDVLLGKSLRKGALLGQIPNVEVARREIESLVDCLLDVGSIHGMGHAHALKGRFLEGVKDLPTHTIRKQGKHRRIQRMRFSCCG